MNDACETWEANGSKFYSYTDKSTNDFWVECVVEKKPDGTIRIVEVSIVPKTEEQ